MTDEQLLLRYRETGDRSLFARLVRRYERELYSYLRRFLGNAESAEDVFQQTFLRVHLKCNQFQSGRKFRPWLYSIATNQAIDSQRRNKRHRLASLNRRSSSVDQADAGELGDLLESQEPNPFAEAAAFEDREWVRDAVADLPEHLRVVVQLVYYQGMKYRDAAEVLGIPVGTVKSRLHSVIVKLNEAWNSAYAERE